MNITMFIGSLTGGGAERVLCNLSNFLVSQGHNVTILTVSNATDTYSLDSRVRRESLETNKRLKTRALRVIIKQVRLFSFVCKHKTDAYLVMLPRAIRSIMLFRRFIKVPIIISERNSPTSYDKNTQRYLIKATKKADGLVCQTEEAAKWYEGIAKKIVVIPNAINTAFIRKSYEGNKEKCIVAAGRLSGQKNFKLLIDAFSLISDEFSDYSLKIYGKGPLEEELREYAKNKNLASRVEFMGYVDDMPEQLQKATAFVLSSDFEGMPNALMEAMALGLPCVSTDCPCGGPSYLINSGENGILVPVGDAEKMADAIRKILADPELSNTLSNNAREIGKRLAPEKIYKEWETQILSVVEESKRPH